MTEESKIQNKTQKNIEISKTIYDLDSEISDKFKMIHSAFSKASNHVATIDFRNIKDSTNSNITKQQLELALSNRTESNTKLLIQASNYFYLKSGEYRQLIHRFAGIHKYRNVIFPRYILEKTLDIRNEDEKISKYVLSCRVEETCFNIGLKALIDGTAYTFENVVDNNICTQFLPSDYCRTRNFDSFGNKIVEFNFKYFDEKYQEKNQRELVFKQLPKEFNKLYESYKKGKSNIGDDRNAEWQQLNFEYSRATSFSLDNTPFFCAIFPDLLDYVDYKSLNKLSSELDLFTILIQKSEFDPKTGDLLVNDETMDVLSDTLAKVAKSGGCGAFTTPFNVEALKLRDKSEQKTDYVQAGLTNIYNSSSLPEIAFNSTTKNGGTAGLKSSNEMTEGIFDIVLAQFKNWYFKKFSEISSNIIYDIDFIPITCFNEKDKVANYQQQMSFGGSKFYYFASMGINQFELSSLLDYEKQLGINDKLIVPKNSNTLSSKDNENKAGRKEIDDSEKADSTIIQQNNGIDKSRTEVN